MYILVEELHQLIDKKYVSRGKRYYEDGLVELKRIESKKVEAYVAGSQLYDVLLLRNDKLLQGFCNCP
jgi:uncharacterized Zn finger protein